MLRIILYLAYETFLQSSSASLDFSDSSFPLFVRAYSLLHKVAVSENARIRLGLVSKYRHCSITITIAMTVSVISLNVYINVNDAVKISNVIPIWTK